MIAVEQFSEIQDVQVGVGEKGEPIFEKRRVSGRREIELDVMTEAEALKLQPERDRQEKLAALRTEMAAILVEEALGLDVTDRIQELREAYQKL
jgi:hypothetical protein